MSDLIKRAYKGSDANMLTVAGTITTNAITYKTELVAKRSTWADPFLPNLQMRVGRAFPDILGVDNSKSLRDATALVHSIMADATTELSFFKVQVEQDFKSNKPLLNEILTNLGFAMHYAGVTNKSQSALVELLFKFKTNMTPELQTQITAAGTAPALITAITGYADQLINSNISQEALKGSRKVLTQSGLKELNEIYTQVISVALIAGKLFKNDPAIRDQFSYNKLLKAITASSSASGNGGSGNTGTGGTGGGNDNEIQPA